jgi:hypothetical protein
VAFDDFASAEELELKTSVNAEDEDLFDFPDMVVLDAPAAAPVAEEAPAENEASADVPTLPEAPTAPQAQTKAEEAPAATAEAEPATTAAPIAGAAQQNYDPELDEDIFNFAELFTSSESEAGNDVIPAEALFEDPSAEAAEVTVEEPVDAPAPIAEPTQAPAATAPAKPAASTPEAVVPPVAMPTRQRRISTAPSEAPTNITFDVGAENPLRNRMVMIFVIGFVVTNLLLAVLAWRIGDSFKDTLESVRAELSEPRQVIVQGGPNGTPAAPPTQDTQAVTQVEVVDQPAPELVEPFETLELRLAQQEITEGRFHSARRRLNRLLSNQDRSPMQPGTIAEAEFMIARSFLEHGENVGGKQ